MSITLNELLKWHAGLPKEAAEEAQMVRALIALHEEELRARVANLIAAISQHENWKLQRCSAIARRVEQTPAEQLESIHEYLRNRCEGLPDIETPESLSDFFADRPGGPDVASAPALPEPIAPIERLHALMGTLESRIAPTPGVTCGVRGIRIMRMVALMSQARSAQIARMRMTGTQAFYRHS